jgi:hypothetical protein
MVPEGAQAPERIEKGTEGLKLNPSVPFFYHPLINAINERRRI